MTSLQDRKGCFFLVKAVFSYRLKPSSIFYVDDYVDGFHGTAYFDVSKAIGAEILAEQEAAIDGEEA